MQSLTFNSLYLLSERERKARRVVFNPKRNLLLGRNHVGKSTVTKLIFETLGATPLGRLEHWDAAAISLLSITVAGEELYIVRQRSNRALFDSRGELITATARESEWAQTLARSTGFNLVLSDKNEKTAQGDAACMFLPFYINQDGGWTGVWHTFKGMARFRAPQKSIVEYFTQTLPPQFYEAKAQSDAVQRKITAIDEELRILNRTREKLASSLDLAGPQISADAFELEIKEITRQLSSLNAAQEALRAEAVSLQEGLSSAEHQIALATAALKRFQDDFCYLSDSGREDLVCPTCGAQHEETFLSVLQFAEDARSVTEMLIRLQENRELLVRRLTECKGERLELAGKYDALQALLETRRGELKFADVVRSMGSGVALNAFDQEDQSLERTRNEWLLEKDRSDREMKAFRSAKRRKAIKLAFQAEYQKARIALNLPSRDVSHMQVASRPDISGSAGPREVLAYYAALWWVSRSPEFGSPFSLPIIVDCPAQSGQDKVNLPAMIHFISSGLPSDAQVLLTYEEDVSEEFDARHDFDTPYSLLLESEYDDVAEAVLPKAQTMFSSLLRRADVSRPTLFEG